MSKPLWLQMLDDSPRRAEMERAGQPGRVGYASGGLVPRPAPHAPSPDDARLDPDQLAALIRAAYRQGDIFPLPFIAGLVPILLRPASNNRRYLMIQNQHAANSMALGIGQQPGPLTGVPVSGLIIPFNFGFYEPLMVPQGEIWIVASAANTNGILLYSE